MTTGFSAAPPSQTFTSWSALDQKGKGLLKIFLSHVHEDAHLAHRLGRHLRSSGVEVFDPDVELGGGENWRLKVGGELERADAMVVVFSDKYGTSAEARAEMLFALGNPNFENRLVPVVVGRSAKRLPWFIKSRPFVRHKGSLERTAREISKALGI